MQTSCCHPRGGKGNGAIFYWESGNDGSVGSSQCVYSFLTLYIYIALRSAETAETADEPPAEALQLYSPLHYTAIHPLHSTTLYSTPLVGCVCECVRVSHIDYSPAYLSLFDVG